MDYFGCKNFPFNGNTFPTTDTMNYYGQSQYTDHGIQRSKEPITTASSVLGIKFKDGVVIGADTLASYGILARFRHCPRIFKVNKNIIVGAGGDYADFQYVKEMITQKVIEEDCIDDGFYMKPKALYHWLTRIMYTRRTQLDPFWNDYVIGGIQDGEPFLGAVDKLGTAFTESYVATGLGSYLAVPLFRDGLEASKSNGGLTKDEAINLVYKALEVLYYRDAKSWPKFQIGIITADGVTIEGPFAIKGKWDIASSFQGYD